MPIWKASQRSNLRDQQGFMPLPKPNNTSRDHWPRLFLCAKDVLPVNLTTSLGPIGLRVTFWTRLAYEPRHPSLGKWQITTC